MGGVEDGDYLSVTPAGGSNNGVVAIESTMNITPSDRSMEVVLKGSKGDARATVSVSQPSGYQAEKTVTVTENGTTEVLPDDGKLAMGKVVVGVNVSSSGGGDGYPAFDAKGVFFFDYDGTLLYSYTIEEAQALAELPVVPKHKYLTPDGWTHTLDQVKSVKVRLNVGAIHKPSSWQVYVRVNVLYSKTYVKLPVWGSTMVRWGDSGNVTIPPINNPRHLYKEAGEFWVYSEGSIGFKDTSSIDLMYNCIKEIFLGRYGDAVNAIGDDAFAGLGSLDNATLCRGWTFIRDGAFSECSGLSGIVIPDGVSSIGEQAFSNCTSLGMVVLPTSVTTIGVQAFWGCTSLSEIVIPPSVTSLGGNVFLGCTGLRSVVFSEGVSLIGAGMFEGCWSLSSVVIPEGVTTIPHSAFSYCTSLPSIVLPSSVTMIEAYAFDTTSSLSHLILKSVVPPTLSNLNAFSMSAAQIYVPDASVKDYKSASVWSSLASRIHPLSDLGLS